MKKYPSVLELMLLRPSGAVMVCVAVSLVSLTGALAAQLALGMAPCQMCIYQRIPYIAILVLSFIGAFARDPKAIRSIVGVSFLMFCVNSVLALYHTGIEHQWWTEGQGCKVSFDFTSTSSQNLLQQITSAQTESCAIIPWQDPIIGLSMANYNFILCVVMAAYCFIVIKTVRD